MRRRERLSNGATGEQFWVDDETSDLCSTEKTYRVSVQYSLCRLNERLGGETGASDTFRDCWLRTEQ